MNNDSSAVSIPEPTDMPEVVVIPDGDPTEHPIATRVINGYRQRRLRIELPGTYRGTWVEIWTNAPRRLMKRFGGAGGEEDAIEAFCEWVLAHNLKYEDGSPLPTPLTPDVLDDVEQGLLLSVIRVGMEEMNRRAGITKS